jgi:hypothetical protein
MKTTLLSFLAAALVGFASHAFNSADFTAILFTTGLVAWTINQYSRQLPALTSTRPIRFPVAIESTRERQEEVRLAA